VTRLLMLLTACVAVTPVLALDRARPPCPATEVAPGVKMRTGGCPMMFLPMDHEPTRDRPGTSPDASGPWMRGAELPAGPAMPVRQTDGLIRP
jgi:hypothetical protein